MCACRLSADEEFVDASRPVMMQDFRKTLETFRPSGQHSQEYRQEQANTGQVYLASRRSWYLHQGNGLSLFEKQRTCIARALEGREYLAV